MLSFGVFGAPGGTDRDRDRVGLGHRFGWGFSCGRSLGLSFLSLGPWCFPFFLALFYFLSVIGGSGGLSHGAVSGFFFPFLFYFLFFVDIGTFSEH